MASPPRTRASRKCVRIESHEFAFFVSGIHVCVCRSTIPTTTTTTIPMHTYTHPYNTGGRGGADTGDGAATRLTQGVEGVSGPVGGAGGVGQGGGAFGGADGWLTPITHSRLHHTHRTNKPKTHKHKLVKHDSGWRPSRGRGATRGGPWRYATTCCRCRTRQVGQMGRVGMVLVWFRCPCRTVQAINPPVDPSINHRTNRSPPIQ